MSSYQILHEVGIKAAPQAIFEALTDVKKLAAWWTSDTRGNGAKAGGILEFWFGDFCQKFEVMELQPGRYVKWKATQKDACLDEWVETEIRFKLCPEEDQCIVHFTHSGWRDDSGVFSHCSTKWAVFLVSLKELLEKGRGRPAPDDIEINHY